MRNLAGLKFGRFTVLRFAMIRGNRNAYWVCRCDCGIEKAVGSRHLMNGRTKSCGCLNREYAARAGRANRTHGRTGSTEYRIWAAMLQRCGNPNSPRYEDYGGRGITVCSRWNSFSSFYADMGPRPSKHLSLDRIKNHLGYYPGNCRWATRSQQHRNSRRQLHWIEFQGRNMILTDWAARLGIDRTTLWRRIRLGWPVERVLTEPVQGQEAPAQQALV